MKPYIILTILLFFTACNTRETAQIRISQEQAREMMQNQNVVIIDVRTPGEFASGFIENAVLMPLDEIASLAPYLIPDKDQTLLIYCRSGSRSNTAAHVLIEMGYTSVYDFGGIIDWQGEIVR